MFLVVAGVITSIGWMEKKDQLLIPNYQETESRFQLSSLSNRIVQDMKHFQDKFYQDSFM